MKASIVRRRADHVGEHEPRAQQHPADMALLQHHGTNAAANSNLALDSTARMRSRLTFGILAGTMPPSATAAGFCIRRRR